MAKKPTDFRWKPPLRLAVRRNADGWFVIEKAKPAERRFGPYPSHNDARDAADGMADKARADGREASVRGEWGRFSAPKGWR